MPTWREDGNGRAISLMITRTGREAIGVEKGAEASADAASMSTKGRQPTNKGAQSTKQFSSDAKDAAQKTSASAVATPPRDGSKQALVVGMLSENGGATLDALVEATGWLPHTTRAALTGLRRRGFVIERSRADDAMSVYRIAGSAAA